MKVRAKSFVVVPCAAALLGFPGPVAQAVAAPSIAHAPRVPWPFGPGQGQGRFGTRNSWAASNWSGYAETGTFKGVAATWTVPSVSASSSATYSSAWIGVDGFNNSNLIQTGTEEDYYSGTAHYSAWWEILPAAETVISHPVSPGDRMSASIYETTTSAGFTGFFRRRSGGYIWVINIADTTAGHTWTDTLNEAYSGSGSSAEWVVEAPEVGGRIATLANYSFGTANGLGGALGDFDNAGTLATQVSSGTPAYAAANLNYTADSGVMIQNSVQVSTPGDPNLASTTPPAAAGIAFNAQYGSGLPATPTS